MQVECRGKLYPGLPLSQLGQTVKCNTNDGLVCLNKNQGLIQRCFDYEIKVLCCVGNCDSLPTHTPLPVTTRVSSTRTSTSANTSTPTVQSSSPSSSKSTTYSSPPGCVCSWSDWLDFGGPTTGPEGGEVIPIEKIAYTYPSLCKVPMQVECRGKLYPGLPLSQLGQTVKCNAKDGLVCLNKNQGLTQRCFDYEIRVLCCKGNCGILPTYAPSSTSMSTPTVQSFSSSTTPTLATSTTTPSTSSLIFTKPESTTYSPSAGCACSWSDWLDFGAPTTGPDGGELILIKGIFDIYPSFCKVPVQVECRAKMYPTLLLSELGQVVKCNANDGLICLNKDQDMTQQCFDYEIRVSCCNGNCYSSTQAPITTPDLAPSATPHLSTLTPECICNWSEWFDFGSPTTGSEGGEMIPINEIISVYPNTSAPIEIKCRAKLYPELKLSQLGQVVTCNTKDGLVCLNKNQGVTQQCFDYEIKLLCCQGLCEVTPSTSQSSYFSSSTISTTTFPVLSESTKRPSTEHQDCFCEINGDTFAEGYVIYNTTDGDGWCYIAKCAKTEEMKCDVIKLSVPCLTTVSPSTSTPFTGNCYNHVPPLANGESVNWGNCHIDTCMNSTIKHSAVECEPVEYPVCMNGYPPLKIPDESGCCYKYQCQCICSGFGDPHYITFDGTYYPFQGNCSYVLVKEINLKYNFSVIIDNVFCDSEDGLSCPKSLTVYYKSFEIFMAQEISAGVVTNLIYVNQKKVSLPFQSEEFRVTENGIESLLVIPEISAQIYFTGMMFSIHLPYRDFYGNTEGHCGTCDNNQSDDCRLPNGTIASSCQDMASHWQVKNRNSVCPPPKPEPTPIPCPPPAICKIIESELFEKCRKLVPHEPYVKACNLDVCHMSETIGCSSLQAYADECAMAGICVDWRPATDGACDLKCKEPQVYKACGPQVEPTCDERFNLKYIHQNDAFRALESMIWEGCHCPNGTTLLSPNSNICVTTREICMLPNGGWKKANDTWMMGCEMCRCEEESLTVHCEALSCPTQDPDICHEIGQVKVTETVDCCEINKCA
ncbi:mucin-5AC [Misgurnus anguillicaudatus]|uniref:mucin-5AC n=1 Tax=Misgurnus anguillicaudatus TaxID=75329 RepID=UPI003CCF16AC